MFALTKFPAAANLCNKETAHFLLTLLDPRGRCNRKGLMVLALALLGVQFVAGVGLNIAGLGLDTPAGIWVSAVFLWVGFAATSKRLHDCNLRAWWFLAAIAVWLVCTMLLSMTLAIVLGADSMAEGAVGYWIALLTMMLAVVAAMLWLHLKPGDAGTNRFGPAPRGNGFAMPVAVADHRMPNVAVLA